MALRAPAGGLPGGALLVLAARYAPAALQQAHEVELPLVARLLYGGIIEELGCSSDGAS